MNFSKSPLKNRVKKPVQLALKSYSHGGVRKNAGRKKANAGRRKVAHRERETVQSKLPFHLTVRVKGAPVLRTKKSYGTFRRALGRAKKFGLRTIHFALLGNHFHLLCEADSNRAVTQGVRSLNCSLVKSLGLRVEDRYHLGISRTPAQVRETLIYIFSNSAKHFKRAKVFDYFSSYLLFEDEEGILSKARKDLDWRKPKAPVHVYLEFTEALSGPRSWLARKGWMKSRGR